jgi:4-hydroxy-tetrahydrodipicolinate reductase
MRLAIVGAGKMGRAVRAAAEARGHEVAVLLRSADNPGGAALTAAGLRGVDVALEFTRPDAAPGNLERLIEAGIPAVTGTTGWLEHLPRIERLVEERGGTLLHAANFSPGLHLLLRAARELARGLRGLAGYDGAVLEWHHREKRDAPSGTAAVLREALREADPERDWPVTSVRLGAVPGTHAVEVDARFESLSVVHRVRDRAVFAEGAVTAAEWVVGRHGVYTFADVLGGDS